ncbi:uncharacterized protein [Populus alba]|uniref:uncharacterized protein isoform X5 n=1 Tax=Populus alba TaxID=43335 RepID=UPI003CC7195E
MARTGYWQVGTPKMEKHRERIEELLKFTLESHINQTLEFNLRLSKDFCINLLEEDPNDMLCHSTPTPTPTDSFDGVALYPLYKRLASALYRSVKSGAVCRTYEKMVFGDKDSNLKQKEENWDQLIKEKGLELINVLEGISCEIHVQEPYFSLLKDGRKTIEGRCATGDYIRMFADMLHFRRCCKLRISRRSFLVLKLLKKVSRFIGSFIQKKRKCLMVSSQSVFQN